MVDWNFLCKSVLAAFSNGIRRFIWSHLSKIDLVLIYSDIRIHVKKCELNPFYAILVPPHSTTVNPCLFIGCKIGSSTKIGFSNG